MAFVSIGFFLFYYLCLIGGEAGEPAADAAVVRDVDAEPAARRMGRVRDPAHLRPAPPPPAPRSRDIRSRAHEPAKILDRYVLREFAGYLVLGSGVSS